MYLTSLLTVHKLLGLPKDRQNSAIMCVDFNRELKESLVLFRLSFLADYFPQLIAATSALIIYLTFIKPSPESKWFPSLIILFLVYFLTLKFSLFLTHNLLSYCL